MHPFALTVQSAQKKAEVRRSVGALLASGFIQLSVLGLLLVAPFPGTSRAAKAKEGGHLVYTRDAVVVRPLGPASAGPKTARHRAKDPRPAPVDSISLTPAPPTGQIGPDLTSPTPPNPGPVGPSGQGKERVPPSPEPQLEVARPRPGGVVELPRKVKHVEPLYPAAARLARIAGDVVLEAIIDAQGNVKIVRIVQSIPLLDPAATEAVRQWKYESTLLNGVPVSVVMMVRVTFRLH